MLLSVALMFLLASAHAQPAGKADEPMEAPEMDGDDAGFFTTIKDNVLAGATWVWDIAALPFNFIWDFFSGAGDAAVEEPTPAPRQF